MPPTMAAVAAGTAHSRDQLRQPTDRISRQRLEAQEAVAREMKEIGAIFRKYDVDKSSRLEEKEVKNLLRDMNIGKEPSQEELDFIFKLCDTKCSNGAIDFSELADAIAAWKVYLRHKDDMHEALKQFDKTRDGQLQKEEVKCYLVHLNSGMEVTDREVDFVMTKADLLGDGACSGPELVLATAAWYTLVKEEESNACCVVC